MLAAFLQGKAFLFPGLAGAGNHWQGLRIGLLQSLHVYLLAFLVLAFAAVYEALIVIYLLPQLV